jgi:hypothetical protein
LRADQVERHEGLRQDRRNHRRRPSREGWRVVPGQYAAISVRRRAKTPRFDDPWLQGLCRIGVPMNRQFLS